MYILHQSITDDQHPTKELKSTHNLTQSAGKTEMHYLQVINLKVLSILGKDACVNLGLLKRLKVNAVNISLDNPQLCEALGKLPGQYCIKRNPDATPIIHAPWRIAYAIKDKVKRELDCME